MEEKVSGVKKVVPVAEEPADQSEFNLDNYFDEVEDSGGEVPADAELGEVDQEDEETFADDRVEKAFAKRLAVKEAQIRKEFEQRYSMSSVSPPLTPPYSPVAPVAPPTLQTQPPAQPLPNKLTPEQLNHLAEKFATTPELVEVMYNQQLVINQQGEVMRNVQSFINQMQEGNQKSAIIAQVESHRKKNPALPAFDESRASQIRQQHQQLYGILLPWDVVYRQMVAEDTLTGDMSRQTEQQTIKKIVKRGRSSVEKKGVQSASQPGLWELSNAQFEKMIDNAKQGKYKKS